MTNIFNKDPVKGLLIDISGVLKNGDQAIPGSIEAVKRLQDSNFPFRLVTNESQITVKELTNKLNSLGFHIKENVIFSPIAAAIKIIKNENLRPLLLLHPNVINEFKEINQLDPDCVVIGDVDEGFTYANMNKVFRTLMKMEKPLLFSLGKEKYYREENNELTLDVGAYMMSALESATGINARVIGKPDAKYFLAAVNDMGISPDTAVMIGDDIASDVGGAQKAKLRGILVRTGKYQLQDENNEDIKPDAIFNNFNEIIKSLFEAQL